MAAWLPVALATHRTVRPVFALSSSLASCLSFLLSRFSSFRPLRHRCLFRVMYHSPGNSPTERREAARALWCRLLCETPVWKTSSTFLCYPVHYAGVSFVPLVFLSVPTVMEFTSRVLQDCLPSETLDEMLSLPLFRLLWYRLRLSSALFVAHSSESYQLAGDESN